MYPVGQRRRSYCSVADMVADLDGMTLRCLWYGIDCMTVQLHCLVHSGCSSSGSDQPNLFLEPVPGSTSIQRVVVSCNLALAAGTQTAAVGENNVAEGSFAAEENKSASDT